VGGTGRGLNATRHQVRIESGATRPDAICLVLLSVQIPRFQAPQIHYKYRSATALAFLSPLPTDALMNFRPKSCSSTDVSTCLVLLILHLLGHSCLGGWSRQGPAYQTRPFTLFGENARSVFNVVCVVLRATVLQTTCRFCTSRAQAYEYHISSSSRHVDIPYLRWAMTLLSPPIEHLFFLTPHCHPSSSWKLL
jgi:hypothetical protein